MIFLSSPNISGNEWKYVKDCLDTSWISSVGSYVNKFEEMMAEFTGTKYAIATSNGTMALHISLLLAEVKRENYVIVPNLTFVASANSITYTGASPIFMDIDENTWQMDLDLLENFLQTETELINNNCILKKDKRIIRAIMPVHVLGNMIDMDRLIALTNKYSLSIVEDATEALGSYYKKKHSGSLGLMGCFSFNGNKIITSGGGGMLVTDNEQLAKKAKHLTTQAKADPFEYYHDEIAYNYRLVNILAAIGVAQMEQLPGFLLRKKEIDVYYKKELSKIGDICFQKIMPGIEANQWLFTFRSKQQKKILKTLNEKGMQSRPFWVPMNRLPMYTNELYISENDKSGKIYSECVSIPCSTHIKDEELQAISESIKSCY